VVVLERIPKYPAVGMEGSKIDFKYLDHVSELIEQFTGRVPRNLVEVGANYAQDAFYLSGKWNLSPKSIYTIEPHPEIAERISNHYEFVVIPKAVSNVNGEMLFNAVDLGTTSNAGISSLLGHTINDPSQNKQVTVQVIRLDTFLKEFNLKFIDFLKIDVEGMTFEVLDGLGALISNVTCIQLESEYIQVWEGQKVQNEVYSLLDNNGFQLVDHILQMDGIQADSLWIRQELVHHRVFDITNQKWVDRA
jgi:FkbM family methyltransferase